MLGEQAANVSTACRRRRNGGKPGLAESATGERGHAEVASAVRERRREVSPGGGEDRRATRRCWFYTSRRAMITSRHNRSSTPSPPSAGTGYQGPGSSAAAWRWPASCCSAKAGGGMTDTLVASSGRRDGQPAASSRASTDLPRSTKRAPKKTRTTVNEKAPRVCRHASTLVTIPRRITAVRYRAEGARTGRRFRRDRASGIRRIRES